MVHGACMEVTEQFWEVSFSSLHPSQVLLTSHHVHGKYSHLLRHLTFQIPWDFKIPSFVSFLSHS